MNQCASPMAWHRFMHEKFALIRTLECTLNPLYDISIWSVRFRFLQSLLHQIIQYRDEETRIEEN